MSSIITYLSRPTTLSILAICGTGAFYIGLKSKTVMAKQAQKGSDSTQSGSEAVEVKDVNYQVSTGRSGGGV